LCVRDIVVHPLGELSAALASSSRASAAADASISAAPAPNASSRKLRRSIVLIAYPSISDRRSLDASGRSCPAGAHGAAQWMV
jgi:hypothetical protein